MINHTFCNRRIFERSRKQFPSKLESGQELRQLHDNLQQHIRALKVSGEYDVQTYLTAAFGLKLHEANKLQWTKHSRKCKMTPPYEEFLEFLDVQD